MNKRPRRYMSARAIALEERLMGKIIANQDEIDTGTRKVREPSRWQRKATRRTRGLSIKQGTRRRHPNQVLHNFATVSHDTKAVESQWEKALTDETDRQALPTEFEWKPDTALMANQMGLVKTAMSNFAKSKYKLSMQLPVGV